MYLIAAGVVSSAFCLFLIQPMMAKRLLPVFGGSASVWAVCLVFYQAMLLLGYLYAHALARRLEPRKQALVHGLACGVALLALQGVTTSISWPGEGAPAAGIVAQLLATIGAPYLLLAATSPLLQYWHSLLYPQRVAYRLFAWSNLSCVLALLAFPFLFEPNWGWMRIAGFWQWLFAAAAILHLGAAALVWLRHPVKSSPAPVSTATPLANRDVALWLFLAFLGSALLVAVTDHLCLVVAPFPLLWVLPLLIYLLSFVVTFESDRYRRAWGAPLAFAGLVAMAAAMNYLAPSRMLGLGVVIFSLGLFAACLFLHGELALRRPPERQLTSFYIAMAAGGALGSVFVALIAPLLFHHHLELPILLALASITVLFVVYRYSWITDVAATAAVIFVVVSAGAQWLSLESNVVAAARNFYGALRVTERQSPVHGRLRTLIHGSVNHGSQAMDEDKRRTSLTYYTPSTGVGMLLSRENTGPRRVGLVGLGSGALAAYARPGDVFRFYEINPLVVDMAMRYFTYLADAPARVEVALGDARLLLAREPDQHYDVLVVDAFTGDSVPVHLLTREAMEIYGRHLKPDGVLAMHLSNLHLNLAKVALALGRDMGWRAAALSTSADADLDSVGAVWVLMDRKPDTSGPAPGPRLLWTDDYSSLLHIMR